MPTHLSLPIVVNANGRLSTVVQGSPQEIAQSLALLVSTVPGERRSVPDYGVPDPVFGGVDVDEISAAAAEWEDRAEPALVEQLAAGVLDQLTLHPAPPAAVDEED